MKKSLLRVLLSAWALLFVAGATSYSQSAAKLAVTSVNGGLNPQAGVPFSVTVFAQDTSGAPSNVVLPTTVTLSLNTGSGVLGGTLTGNILAGTNSIVIGGVTYTAAQGGVSLTATASGGDPLTAANSAPFTVVAGPATKIAFTTQPGNGASGSPFSTQPVVTLLDANNNTVTGTGQTVTIAIQSNPGGGTLSGTTSLAVNTGTGQASFTNLSIDKTGPGYTLTATGNSVSTTPGVVVSSGFNITPGAPAKLAFTTQPGNGTGGSPFSTQPVVTLLDANNNTVTGTGQTVTIAIQSNPGGGTLSGTTSVAVNTGTGQASFSNLSIDKTGTGYTLTATGNSVSTTPGVVVSTGFNVTTGSAAKLAFTTQPGNGTGGSPLTTQPVVTLQDAGGNTVTGTPQNVTVAIQNNAGPGGTLSGTTSVALNMGTGTAAFSNLSIDKVGNGYTLTATGNTVSTSAGTVVSSPFNVTVGAAQKVIFSQQPTNTAAGASITPAVTVHIEDAGGNLTSDSRTVTVAIGTNPSGGTLGGTTSVSAVSGTATFGNLSIDRSGNGYTLTAAASGLAGATSASFNIGVGGAAKIAFTTQPGNGTGGSTFSTQPVVTLQDANGNTVTGTAQNVTVSIQNNAGPGGVLSGTLTVAVNTSTGQATFTNLSIDKAGTGYTLTAIGNTVSTSPGVVISSAFNVTMGPAVKIAITTQPGAGTGGSAFSVQPAVTLQDAGGNTVTGTAQNITFAIQNNAGPGGVLSGTNPVAVNTSTGVATFTNLSIDKIGTGYTLTATGSTVNTTPGAVVSSAFNISLGPASRLNFAQQPTSTAAGATITPAVTVRVEDAGGNLTADTRSVTMAIGTNPSGGTLSGTLSNAAVAGVATFNNLSIDKNGNGYTLSATASSLTSATSAAFNIATGSVTHFTVEASSVGGAIGAQVAGTPFNIRLVARDAGNNVVTSFTGAAVVTSNGTLSAGGGTTGAFTAGLLDPWAVTITNTGSDSITATRSGGSEKGTSNVFAVNPGILNNFLVENAGGGTIPQQTAGAAFSVRITARDAFLNTLTSFSATAFLTSNAGLVGSPVTTPNFVSGVLASQSVTLTLAGSGNRTITATRSGGSETGTSAAFTVVAGPAAAVAVSAGDNQSVAAGAAFPTALAALVSDAYTNPVNGSTVTFVSPAAGATGTWTGGLHSTTASTNASGIATVPLTFTANATAGSYVDTARIPGGATPALYHLTNTASAASRLTILTQPSTPNTAGIVFGTQPVVRIEDAGGNLVTTFAGTVTATRLTGKAALQGQVTVTVAGGLATFSNLSYNVSDTITIQFTSSPALTAATSGSIIILPGAPAAVVYIAPPATTTAGVTMAAVTAQIRDSFGNPILAAGTPIAVALSAGTGPLNGTTTQNTNASGIATFADLSITSAGSKTLTATNGTLTSAVSSPFTINPAAAGALSFSSQPSNANAGSVITPAITVQLRDQFGNNATTPVTPVTLSLISGTGTLNGTVTQTTNGAGLATFANLSISVAGQKTLQASSGTLTPDTSAVFTISTLGPKQLVFSRQPSAAVAGVVIAPSVLVQVQDSLGNNLTNNGITVVLSLTGTGVLSGGLTQTTANGVATFADLSVNLAGSKTLTATTAGLTPATSTAFTISAAAAARLAFTTQPGGATAGAALAPQPLVTLQDAFGNTVTGTAQTVTLALQTNPPGDTLRGTTQVAVNTATGVATFAGLSLFKSAAGYTLTATGSTVSTTAGIIVSSPFNVVPAAASTVRVETAADGSGTVQPARNISSGQAITLYSIARDQYNNFIDDTVAVWSLINRTGGILPGDLVPGGDGKSAVFTGGVIGTAQVSAVTGALAQVPSGVLTVVVAGIPTKIRVETSANGNGVVLPDTTIASGKSITVYAIARDNANNFVRNVTASWVTVGATGGVLAGDLVPLSGKSAMFTGHVVGTTEVRADSATLTATPSGKITVIPGTPAVVVASAGLNQAVLIGTSFPVNLQSTVRDSSGNAVGAGVLVTFSAPTSGAGGTFTGGSSTATALTNAGGVAAAPTFKANRVAGTYSDSAKVAGIAAPALFTLTNSAGTAVSVAPVAGATPQHTQISTFFPVALGVLAKDSSGNPVPGVSILYNGPASGASGAFGDSRTYYSSAVTGTNGIATPASFAANGNSGSYSVSATAAGISVPALFLLTNDPGSASGISANGGTPQSAVVNALFADSLHVIVTDGKNPVPNVRVVFTAPSSGASVRFSRTGSSVDSALTDGGGLASSSACRADTIAGAFQVSAAVPGISGSASFALTNNPGPAARFTIEAAPSGGPVTAKLATVPFGVLITSRDQYQNPAIFPNVPFTIAITSNAPLLSGGGNVPFGEGSLTSPSQIDSVAFAGAGISDTLRVVRVGGTERGLSNAFRVDNPVPSVTAVLPDTGSKGETISVVITGTGFISGTSFPFFGIGITPTTWTVNSPTQMTVSITIAKTAPDSAYPVSVINGTPGGGSGTLPLAFTVGSPRSSRTPIAFTIAFPTHASAADYAVTDYRLVSIPGRDNYPVARFLSGTAGTDWQVFWDNGAQTNYLVQYAAGSPFIFVPGRAFWLVRKGNLVVQDTVSAVAVDTAGNATISLHPGWNLIGSPFADTVRWADVVALNPLAAAHPFAYAGNWQQSDTLAPFAGYIYENDTLNSLKIPSKSTPKTGKIAASYAPGSWNVWIDMEAGGSVERVTMLGVSPGATPGRNPLDFHRPRAWAGIPSTVFDRPAWDSVNSAFATDVRPVFSSAETWEFNLRTSLRTPVKFGFRGVESVPSQFGVYLADVGGGRVTDLRSTGAYTLTPSANNSSFRIVIGTKEAAGRLLDDIVPKAFVLGDNYPNPFNPSTTIPVAIPKFSRIRLAVYNILGQEVRTLYTGSLDAGNYAFIWDGSSESGRPVSTGVYIVRMTTGAGAAFVHKLLLLK
jgi:hypothetical protein